MTKENKLALVVGFALILLVGILISDHFSAAGTQQSADLLPAEDPLVQMNRDRPDLLQFQPPTTLSAQSRGRLVSAVQEQPVVRMPDLQRQAPAPKSVKLPKSTASTSATSATGDRFHDVRQGETLSSICGHYYGGKSLVTALARYNGMDDANQLSAGTRLRIPTAAQLGGGPTVPTPQAAPSKPPSSQTYVVQSGDVLSLIAQRLLGSSRRWPDLYDANRSVIDDPDHLEVGTVLQLPSS